MVDRDLIDPAKVVRVMNEELEDFEKFRRAVTGWV